MTERHFARMRRARAIRRHYAAGAYVFLWQVTAVLLLCTPLIRLEIWKGALLMAFGAAAFWLAHLCFLRTDLRARRDIRRGELAEAVIEISGLDWDARRNLSRRVGDNTRLILTDARGNPYYLCRFDRRRRGGDEGETAGALFPGLRARICYLPASRLLVEFKPQYSPAVRDQARRLAFMRLFPHYDEPVPAQAKPQKA